ncbi:acyl-CoA dehydrogenase family protein [Sulfitobacter sp. S190]|uniref:acyl-CoA dehydrogenase family protein n=1 Tax=Sulfitobacter sp. S190 TaxID=2867022 RepID=UPI0021A7D069|nr:acyl-CoA dehydrogenase family protein [Sulfitobacter sp. S190]UWR24328.1 acyl-CoA/acyl-ACP dehydrogenase [Sulfitobacter sp. S190]
MVKLVHSDEEVMLRDMARGFLDDAAPVSALRKLRDTDGDFDRGLWSDMAKMGWAGVLVPDTSGGSDMGHAAANLLAGEMGKTLVASPFISTAIIAATALRQLANARSTDALARIADGSTTYALAIDEGPKHAPEDTQLAAQTEGNGFRLQGQKRFVVDGGFADRLLVLARTDGGLTLFDVPADRAGITAHRHRMIDARDSATIDFDDVVADGADVIGHVDEAMTVLRPALLAGRAALAAETTGLAVGVLDMTVGYLKERKQFGIEIGRFQALQHRAAHVWSETEVTASAILNAGRMLDAHPDDADLAVSLAKARATATAVLAVQEGVQMHGGIGMTDAYDMGFYMKRARVSAEWLGDYSYHAEKIAALRGF